MVKEEKRMSIVKKPESGLFKFLFRDALKREDAICFKGRNGFLMAPMGSKVIVTSENGAHQCKGNCENCKCRSPKKALAAPVFDGPESKERVAV